MASRFTPELGMRPELGPGENLFAEGAGGGWVFLLPSLELTTVLTFGRPSDATLAMLTRLAHEVIVVQGRRGRPLPRQANGHAHAALRPMAVGRDGRLALPDQCVDVAAVVDSAMARHIARSPRLRAELARVLAPDGRLYVQPLVDPPHHTTALDGLGWVPPHLTDVELLWLITRASEVRAAAPLRDQRAIEHLGFIMRAKTGMAWSMRLVRRLRGRPRRTWRREAAALAGRGGLDGPPRYIARAAAEAGLSVGDYRWGLIDPGRYRTKKILMYLYAADGVQPEFVVKMAREPQFNARTENSRRALLLVEQAGITSPGGAPRLVFLRHHAGLALLAETALAGSPLSDRSLDAATAPELVAAVRWLLDLGIRTADVTVATGPDVAASLREMLNQFRGLYRPEPTLVAFLERQIDEFAAHPGPVPLVLQHGDAGAWNVLVDSAGHPGFIDWEAAVTDGAPLWDILYLLRSCGLVISRKRGERDPLRSFETHFLQRSPMGDLFRETAARFCDATGLSRALVEPLFHLCWMHRSLKEASRMSPNQLQRGHYFAVLRLCMERGPSAAGTVLFAE